LPQIFITSTTFPENPLIKMPVGFILIALADIWYET
jgi:hypothetical protein